MSAKKNNSAEWQLERERFQIKTRFPPKKIRPERTISDILSTIQGEQAPPPAMPQELLDRWPIIVGAQIAHHTYPAYLKGSLLYVFADHPGWLAEIRRLPKTFLLKKMSQIPSLAPIKQIRFQLDPEIRTYRNS